MESREQSRERTGFPSVDKPWLKYYSEEAINAPLPECTIYEYLYENNKDYPSDIAINYLGRKISYKELFENIEKTAAAFLKAGVKEKEIVTVALPSIPEALYCVYALNKIGAVANMIHPLAGKEETLFYFNEVQSRIAVIFDGACSAIKDDIGESSVEKVIVASPADSLPMALKLAYKLKVRAPALDGKVFQSWKSFVREGKGTPVQAVKKDCREMAVISHTGGTTGEPKGVMCSDYNINALIWQVDQALPHGRQERMLVVLPPFINYSLVNGVFEPLSMGHTVILLPKYEPLQFVNYVRKYHPNHMNSIPAFFEALLRIKDAEKADYSCLKHIYYGGEAMSEETETAVNELLCSHGAQYPVGKGLGMSEMVSSASLTLPQCNIPGSAGVPFPRMECIIWDSDAKQEQHCGKLGEICFAGPTMMLGYYNNQCATDEIIQEHPNGKRWLHTGDLGYINEDGVIFVTGRIKRILITKGQDGQPTKMFPDRIEKSIYSYPAVALCCVVGVPDRVRINYPKAYVVLKSAEGDSARIREAILQICRENLPAYMVPDEIEFRTDLPRTARGKIDYRELERENQTKQ